jgi:NhaP-type Na+/H+ or K+/H+ antiporter
MMQPGTFLVVVAVFTILMEVALRFTQKERRKTWPTAWKTSDNIGIVICVAIIVWYVIGIVVKWLQQ